MVLFLLTVLGFLFLTFLTQFLHLHAALPPVQSGLAFCQELQRFGQPFWGHFRRKKLKLPEADLRRFGAFACGRRADETDLRPFFDCLIKKDGKGKTMEFPRHCTSFSIRHPLLRPVQTSMMPYGLQIVDTPGMWGTADSSQTVKLGQTRSQKVARWEQQPLLKNKFLFVVQQEPADRGIKFRTRG